MWGTRHDAKPRAVQGRVQGADIRAFLLRAETCLGLAALMQLERK